MKTSKLSNIDQEEIVYLLTHFKGKGESGLHLSWSEDGYVWSPLLGGQSVLTPTLGRNEQLLRDPAAARGPDGLYHVVWTTGWHETGIGYACTRDFLNFSEPKEIPVVAYEPTTRNAWAPEIAYDEVKSEFVIFWASTVPGCFPETAGINASGYNHRMYATTTRDFVTFAPTKLFLSQDLA